MSTTPKPPRPDFDAIKASADLVKIIVSYGIELKKQGADFVGLCPFHEDKKPSLHITPAKQLWHCPACGAGGNVIQFVAKRDGLSEKEAALQLLARLPGVTRGSEMETPISQPPAYDPLAHSELFSAILTHYHETLLGTGKGGKPGLDYLKKRGLGSIEMLTHFKLGYVDNIHKDRLFVRKGLPFQCLRVVSTHHGEPKALDCTLAGLCCEAFTLPLLVTYQWPGICSASAVTLTLLTVVPIEQLMICAPASTAASK